MKKMFLIILIVCTLVACGKKEPEIFVGIVSEKTKDYIAIDNIGESGKESNIDNRVEINFSECEIRDSRQDILFVENILINKIVEVSFADRVAVGYPDNLTNGIKIILSE